MAQEPTIEEIEAAAKEMLSRREAEDDFYTFVQQAWHIVEPGSRFQGGWALQSIAEHLEAVQRGDIKRLLINQPPRTGKSTLISVLWPAWLWIRNGHEQIMCVSYAESLAKRDNVKARRLIKSTWFQTRWPIELEPDQDTKTRVDNTTGGYRYVAGMDGTITGEGANCVVVGTLVSTDQGDIPIEIVAQNPDKYKAMSYDFSLDSVVESYIVSSLTRKRKVLYEFHTDEGHSVRCTSDHKIYVQGRGFIPASEIDVGARLYCKKRAPNISRTRLRSMQQENGASTLRSEEIVIPEQHRRLLLKYMQDAPPLFQKLKTMRSMRGDKEGTVVQVLFPTVQEVSDEESKRRTDKVSHLPSLFERVCEKVSRSFVLLKGMRRYISFSENDGVGQLELQTRRNMVQCAVLEDEVDYYGARRRKVPGMHCNSRPDGDYKWSDSFVHSYSSHGRSAKQQRTGESSEPLSFVPPTSSCGNFTGITSIEKFSGEEYDVYDIQVARTHNFFANGILVHNCIILDDPNSTRDSSEAALDNAHTFFTDVLPTRFNNFKTGRMVVVQQRTHQLDVSGWILANQSKDWVKLILPMEFEVDRRCVTVPLKSTGGKPWEDPRIKEGELLWPERFGPPELKLLKSALASEYMIAGQLQQRPAPAAGGIIKKAWFQPWKSEFTPKCSYIIQGWDTASSARKEAAYSACLTMGIFKDDMGQPALILLGAWRKRVEFPELYETVQRMVKDYAWTTKDRKMRNGYRPDLVLVEEKSTGIPLIQTFNKAGASLVAWRPDKYGDKIERVRRVTHILESGRVYVPMQAPDFTRPRNYADVLINQAASFPKADSRDFIDVLSMILQRVINSGWIQHPMEKQARDEDEIERQYRSESEQPAFY